MKVDAHQHFWHFNAEEYEWIDNTLVELQRDFLPENLEREIQTLGIEGAVSVQARQCLEETEWLLSLAGKYGFIKGVVGWVPLLDPGIHDILARLSCHEKLKAVRHVVQGESDDEFILRDDFNAGISALKEFGLVYDILIFDRHLPATIEFVDRHPEQTFVLDHIAKPRIKDGLIDDWAAQLRLLALRSNVFCKVSGMVTEAEYASWTVDQIRPYWDTVLGAFGPERIMFGSDWPVCRVACTYAEWYESVVRLAAELSPTECDNLFGLTAVKIYQLKK